jgi:uncharacterized repeat protein (TIGR03803 family)
VGCGTVYEMSPPKQKGGQWAETILYSFQGGNDGYYPSGTLVFDGAGNLDGATLFGGGFGTCDDNIYLYCGTVFKLSPPKKQTAAWTEKVLYSFKGVDQGKHSGDGANPAGNLVLDNKGAIYGTTYFGGDNHGTCAGGSGGTGCGIVFRLNPPIKKGAKWAKQVLHRFNAQDGASPAAGVILDGKGDLYGTAFAGGTNGNGVVFRLTVTKGGGPWKETVLYHFTDGDDGANPIAGLVFDTHGSLYGTAYRGHSKSQYGAAFRLLPPTGTRKRWKFETLYGFGNRLNGGQPASALVLDNAENFFGTTQLGGTGQNCGVGACGVVFSVSP